MAAKKKIDKASEDCSTHRGAATDSYRHSQTAAQRPDVGVQEQFTRRNHRKPTATILVWIRRCPGMRTGTGSSPSGCWG